MSENKPGTPKKYDRSYAYYNHMGEDGRVIYDYPIIVFEDQTPSSDEFTLPRQMIRHFGGKRFLGMYVGITDRKVADNNVKYLNKFLRKEYEYRATHRLLAYGGEEGAQTKEEVLESIMEKEAICIRDPEEDFRLAECLELRDQIEKYIAEKFDDQGRHSRIFRLITDGYSLGEVATRLHMKYHTVRNYQIANQAVAREYREKFLDDYEHLSHRFSIEEEGPSSEDREAYD